VVNISLGCSTVDLLCVFKRRKAEKLRSAEADVARVTSDNFTKRTTSVSRRLTPPFEFSVFAISVTVEGVDAVKNFLSISSCAAKMS